ncbi:hypothetical protein EVAR_22774_1 [Eumeta japonica]|uniref:Uncharacterized protein n=1 Tax=Eumeta variegata TaxID=151549 RepID=A0A4C1USF7_EUMVA|nr:hypothetical protein EVAR_22774_1 [Eumeta japonica]
MCANQLNRLRETAPTRLRDLARILQVNLNSRWRTIPPPGVVLIEAPQGPAEQHDRVCCGCQRTPRAPRGLFRYELRVVVVSFFDKRGRRAPPSAGPARGLLPFVWSGSSVVIPPGRGRRAPRRDDGTTISKLIRTKAAGIDGTRAIFPHRTIPHFCCAPSNFVAIFGTFHRRGGATAAATTARATKTEVGALTAPHARRTITRAKGIRGGECSYQTNKVRCFRGREVADPGRYRIDDVPRKRLYYRCRAGANSLRSKPSISNKKIPEGYAAAAGARNRTRQRTSV